uniref:Uncharacterized protein n=1 Tax=Lepeophtheirus salmonis TaxID=72036 RepID=A0A0K2U9S3_LEPSM
MLKGSSNKFLYYLIDYSIRTHWIFFPFISPLIIIMIT